MARTAAPAARPRAEAEAGARSSLVATAAQSPPAAAAVRVRVPEVREVQRSSAEAALPLARASPRSNVALRKVAPRQTPVRARPSCAVRRPMRRRAARSRGAFSLHPAWARPALVLPLRHRLHATIRAVLGIRRATALRRRARRTSLQTCVIKRQAALGAAARAPERPRHAKRSATRTRARAW